MKKIFLITGSLLLLSSCNADIPQSCQDLSAYLSANRANLQSRASVRSGMVDKVISDGAPANCSLYLLQLKNP
jgi:hypothetical protein